MTRTSPAPTVAALVLAAAALASSPATADGALSEGLDRPETHLFAGPPRVTDRANVVFRFKTVPRHGSVFTCAIDDLPARSCASPYKVRVRPGTHTIRIRAKRDGVLEKGSAHWTWTYRPAED
ncbi:hypothetical protein G5V58_01840 [Nocardioides anomalus]|uniref:Uncharacterized protein n=1 Tax=Nocardioides anomalus TaxID=2712223 RepID=A0A6G6W8Z5_9ACTN|nr:hypothetical protein [Nocardioides anomalus]QIG41679.1 hypothetical protein G5V58_01840 [Nocardioides anomalus]